MTNLIGISGKKRSGKDTVSKKLNLFFPEFELKSYAYRLRQICSILTNKPIEFFLNDNNKPVYLEEWGMNVRELLQKVGTDCFRDNLDKNIWVKSLFSEYKHCKSKWIITDVRFENEVNRIKENGGIVIRVTGNYPNYIKTSDDNHPSETALDNYKDFDYYINNDGTLENLNEKIQNLVQDIK